MSYTLEQRLAIGKEIYDGELTRYEAAKKYDICEDNRGARQCVQLNERVPDTGKRQTLFHILPS